MSDWTFDVADAAAFDGIHAAVAAASTVRLRPRVYLLDEPVVLSSGRTLLGAGNPTRSTSPVVLKPTARFEGAAVLSLVNADFCTVHGIRIDLSDAPDGTIGVDAGGCWNSHFERITIGGVTGDRIGVSAVTGQRGTYWNTWERVYVDGSSALAADAKTGTGWLFANNGEDNKRPNQQRLMHCRADHLETGFHFDGAGGGILLIDCQAESGNTSTGVAVLAENHTATHAPIVVIGGEVNGYARSYVGEIIGDRASVRLSPLDDDATLTLKSGPTLTREVGGTESRERVIPSGSTLAIGGTRQVVVSAPSGESTTIMSFVGDTVDDIVSGLLALTIKGGNPQRTRNMRGLYHLSYRGSTDGSLVELSTDSETAPPELSVTFTHGDGQWDLVVYHEIGVAADVRAVLTGVNTAL